jgi:hypothetical protein
MLRLRNSFSGGDPVCGVGVARQFRELRFREAG